MNLRETFGPVWGGSGVTGFFGEGYWYHRFIPGCDFTGMTLVGKTTTSYYNQGLLPLTETYSPSELFPKCIWIDFKRMIALNAVKLSGPGIRGLLATGKYQMMRGPYFISFMPIALNDDGQKLEAKNFVKAMKEQLPNFRSKRVGIQLNRTCPNVGADMSHLVESTIELLSILDELGLPIVVKLNLLVPPEDAAEIAKHCAGLCVSNTSGFGAPIEGIDWKEYFPDDVSPLKKRGLPEAGGLSGRVHLPLVANWIRRFRVIDPDTHINAGGGITEPDDVNVLRDAGASSVFFASVAMFRPWRVRSIIRRAHEIFAEREAFAQAA